MGVVVLGRGWAGVSRPTGHLIRDAIEVLHEGSNRMAMRCDQYATSRIELWHYVLLPEHHHPIECIAQALAPRQKLGWYVGVARVVSREGWRVRGHEWRWN